MCLNALKATQFTNIYTSFLYTLFNSDAKKIMNWRHICPLILSSVLNGRGWSASRSGRLTRGKNSSVIWIGD